MHVFIKKKKKTFQILRVNLADKELLAVMTNSGKKKLTVGI